MLYIQINVLQLKLLKICLLVSKVLRSISKVHCAKFVLCFPSLNQMLRFFLPFVLRLAEMQFSMKLFVSLVLPAAITIIVSFLWMRKKSKEAEELEELEGEQNVNSEDERERNSDEQTVIEKEISEVKEDTVESDASDAQRYPLEKQPSTTESVQQADSGIETKPSTSSELKDLSGGEESTSEGSVDSSTMLSFTEGYNNHGTPPLGEDNTKSRKGLQSGDKDVWEIEFPQILCGRLIGRKGKNVRVVSEKSGAKIRLIPQSPGEVSTHRIISVTGSSAQIKSALDSIHEKFPCVPLTRLNSAANGPPVNACMQPMVAAAAMPQQALPFVQAMLPSVANFDVVVTSVTDAGHFFVQLHNDFVQRQLQDLHQNMMQCYGQGTAPLILPLPQPIVVGSCCAAPAYTYNGWYRAQVLGPTANPHEVEVKYLDYGGYGRIAASSLRQLR